MSEYSGTYILYEGKLTPRKEIIEAWFWKNPGKPIGPSNVWSEIHPRCTWNSVMFVMRSLKKLGWTFTRVSNDVRSWHYVGTPPAEKDWARIRQAIREIAEAAAE